MRYVPKLRLDNTNLIAKLRIFTEKTVQTIYNINGITSYFKG